MTQEQIEQKKQLLKQTLEEAKALRDELQAAGAWPLDEDNLAQATGGVPFSYPFEVPRDAQVVV